MPHCRFGTVTQQEFLETERLSVSLSSVFVPLRLTNRRQGEKTGLIHTEMGDVELTRWHHPRLCG